MKITLDTNILLRAHRKARGPARNVLDLIVDGPHELIVSQTMLYELEEVLGYPHVRLMTDLTDTDVAEYLEFLSQVCTFAEVGEPRPFPIQDQDDWIVLRTAINGGAEVLCTKDRHLKTRALRSLYEESNIEVMSDVELLKLLRSS